MKLFVFLFSFMGMVSASANCGPSLLGYRNHVAGVVRDGAPVPKHQIGGAQQAIHYLRPPQERAIQEIQKMFSVQNSNLSFLEVGYGHPSALMALAYLYPFSRVSGVEISSAPYSWYEWPLLTELEVGLFTPSHFPKRQDLIFAIDVFKEAKDIKFGQPISDSKESLLEIFKKYIEALNPGGKLLIINDFNALVPLEIADFESLGLAPLRWQQREDNLVKIHGLDIAKQAREIHGQNFGHLVIYEFVKENN